MLEILGKPMVKASASKSVTLGSAASTLPGTLLGRHLLGLHPDLLTQKLEEWGLAPCLNKPGSDACLSSRTTDLVDHSGC